MRLECTKKLLNNLDVKPEKKSDDIDPIFMWTAKLITENKRKMLFFVHVPSRDMFLI